MLFNGKYYNKPGHLGMTRAELLEKLNGGGGGGVILNLLVSPDIGEHGGFYTEKTVDEILTIDNIAALKYTMGDDAYYFPVISVFNDGLDCIGVNLDTFESPPSAVAVNTLEKQLFNDQYHYIFELTGNN